MPDIPNASLIIFLIETALLSVIGLIWLLRYLTIRHLPEIKAERQLHFMHHRLHLICWISSLTLLLLAAGLWFSSRLLFSPIIKTDGSSTTLSSPAPSPSQPVAIMPPQTQPLSRRIEPSVILDMFEATPEGDVTIEALKTRYENSLSGAYILNHCNRTNNQEIGVLIQALQSDLKTLQQHEQYATLDIASLYQSIVSAAEGSYQMIYSRIPCDDEKVNLLEQQFVQFIIKYQASKANTSTEPTP